MPAVPAAEPATRIRAARQCPWNIGQLLSGASGMHRPAGQPNFTSACLRPEITILNRRHFVYKVSGPLPGCRARPPNPNSRRDFRRTQKFERQALDPRRKFHRKREIHSKALGPRRDFRQRRQNFPIWLILYFTEFPRISHLA